MLAEAWLTTPRSDRQPHDDAPSLLLVLGGGGAVFRPGLVARVDADDQRRITVAATGSEDPLATIAPRFGTGEGGRVAITWDAALIDGTALASTPTWREAAAAVAADTSEDPMNNNDTRTWSAGRPGGAAEPAAPDQPEVVNDAGETEHAPQVPHPAAEPEPATAESRPSPRGKKQRTAGSYTSAELDAYQLDKVRDESGEIIEYRVLVAGDTLGTIAHAPYGHRGWIARDSTRIALPHRGGTARQYARNQQEAVIDLLMGLGITTGR